MYIAVRDFGTYNDPLSADRRFRECNGDTGFSKVDIYSGIRLFNALYVSTGLLYITLFDTESQPSSLNICSNGVLNSACKLSELHVFVISSGVQYACLLRIPKSQNCNQ